MKKIFNTLSAILFLQVTSYAQLPANRASSTKVADVLMLQPSKQNAAFINNMKELEGFSPQDFALLLKGLKNNGKTNDAIAYASNSYAFYVMQPGMAEKRGRFSEGLILALDQVKDKEQKSFVLSLIKQAAKNEAIGAVANYLKDDALVQNAALTLSGIGTSEAANALSKSLSNAQSEKAATALVAALGELKSKADEDQILSLLDKYPSENFQRTAFTALSNIGGSKSSNAFLKKLSAVNYQFDKSNVGGLALNYAHQLFNNGQKDLGVTVATTILAEAEKNQSPTLKAGALQLLVKENPSKHNKQLLSAALNENALYRATGLSLFDKYSTDADVKALIKALSGANADVQESIFNYLGNAGVAKNKLVIEKQLPKLDDAKAKIAALNAMTKLDGRSQSSYLINSIAKADEKTVAAIESLLKSSKDTKLIETINKTLPTAAPKTQAVFLNVLAVRTNDNTFKAVLPLLTSKEKNISAAAYKILPNVANVSDYETLVKLLAGANGNEARAIQTALINVLNASADKQSKIEKLTANISRSAAPNVGKYFPVFAGVGGEQALNAVKNYLSNDGLRTQAIAALASWRKPESLAALVALSRTEQDKSFGVVFNGLMSQIRMSDHNAAQKTLFLKDAFAVAKTTAQKKTVFANLESVSTYQALKFAEKYLEDADLKKEAANAVIAIATENSEFVGEDVRAMLTKAMSVSSDRESNYLREAVIRHLAEMPKAVGFQSMFNGVDLTGWKGLVENPVKRQKMSEAELAAKQVIADEKMKQTWSAINGELVFNGKGDNIATIKQYGDFEMLVDWKLDPNGKEPDAGVYLRGAPQVQIWDISRVKVGAQVGSGGLYNNKKNPKDPIKVADNALGEWNSFKIKMLGEKVSVWLNGQLVVDNVTFENYWDRNQSIFPTEQIELQAHGSQVWYRDIYIKELPRKVIYTLSEAEKKEGFEMLFSGENLDKWTESAAYEISPEGSLRANPYAKFGKNLYTKDQFGDFVFRFEFKLTPGANNGLGIRAPLEGDAAYQGTEIQILDNDAEIYKNLKEYQYHGSAYGIMTAKRTGMKPIGEWNVEEVRLQGNKIKVTLNGEVILEGDLAKASKKGTLDGKAHPGLKNKIGHLGFLGHGSEVFFRNIRIKKL